MSEEMVLVKKSSLDMLDEFIKGEYGTRCYIRNHGGEDFYFEDYSVYDEIQNRADRAKELAKEFGMYPYNQKEVKYPLIRD